MTNEPMAFGLNELWAWAIYLVDVNGDALDPSGASAFTSVRVRGGDEVMTFEAVTVAADDEGRTRALFQALPADRLDDDEAMVFAERAYEWTGWAVDAEGVRQDQAGGGFTVY